MFKDINTFLAASGIPALTRGEAKTTMLVKNFEDTKWGKRNPFPAIVMEKLDGVCTLAINIYGKCRLFSRTGKRLTNVGHLEAMLSSFGCLRNTVLCVELCNEQLSLEQIGGIVNPNRVEELSSDVSDTWLEGAYLGAFDILTLSEFVQGECGVRFEDRLDYLYNLVDYNTLPVTIPASLMVDSKEEMDTFFTAVIDNKGEGVVLCQMDAPWIAGYKNHHKTKQVRGVDFDLEVIGLEEGKGKRANMVGKLIVRYADGKPLGVDGRFTDEVRISWFKNPELIVGKIVHVHALQLGSKGALRLPKVRAVRVDKTVGDY